VGATQSPSSSSSHSSGFSASEWDESRLQSAKRKARTRVWDSQRFIVEPTLSFHGILIEDFIGCFIVPVIRLLGIRIRNALSIHPICRLLILRIVNLGCRIDWGSEILEKTATIFAFTID